MDSHHPSGAKRKICKRKYLQSDGMRTRSRKREENGRIKRRKLETNPLRIDHMVEKILSFLDINSIKLARQVNKLWSVEGAKMLINKTTVRLPLNLQNTKSSTKNKTMSQFKRFLLYKSCDLSRIPNIFIDDVCDLELWKSLGVLGNPIHSPKLHITKGKADLLCCLLDLLPDLNYLCFKEMYNKIGIITTLTSIMSTSQKDRRPLILSRMEIGPDTLEELSDTEKFADCFNIKIEELDLYFYNKSPEFEVRSISNINKLLSTSQRVLKKLSLTYCQWYLPSIRIPFMPALTHLDLYFYPETPENLRDCKFSPSFKFSKDVPNLQEINIHCGETETEGPMAEDQDLLVNLFKTAGSAPSVKKVTYSGCYMDSSIDPLFQMFPNMKHFHIFDTSSSHKMFHSLWKYASGLKTLSIDFDGLVRNTNDLDSIFTGFSQETVEKLRKSQPLETYTLEELDKLRVNPSIVDLKELEELALYFYVSDDCLLSERTLAVAGQYGLKLLPKAPTILIRVIDWGDSDNTSETLAALDEVSQLPNVIVQ